MITFNVQSHNGNFYRGHEPSNSHGNCWCGEEERDDALVFTIEQVRELVEAWSHYLNIVISVSAEPISDELFKRELFCAKGGCWYDYKKVKEPFCLIPRGMDDYSFKFCDHPNPPKECIKCPEHKKNKKEKRNE